MDLFKSHEREYGYNHSSEAGIPCMSDEQRIANGKTHKGRTSTFKGQKHSIDSRIRISMSCIQTKENRIMSEEEVREHRKQFINRLNKKDKLQHWIDDDLTDTSIEECMSEGELDVLLGLV